MVDTQALFLNSLPFTVLRCLETEANIESLYDSALLTRLFTQHALRPFIDSKIKGLNLLTYVVS